MDQNNTKRGVKGKLSRSLWLAPPAVCLLFKLLLPDTGLLVLWDEFFTVALILVLVAYAIHRFIPAFKSDRRDSKFILVSVIAALLIGISLYRSVNLVLDVVQGEQTIYLTDCEVGEHRSKGKTRGYYLEGTDESGEIHRFTISAADYDELSGKHGYWTNWSIHVVGYEHTGRVIRMY